MSECSSIVAHPLIQPLAWLSPLWHGVELCRGLALGMLRDEPLLALVHVAVLGTLTVVGLFWAYRTVGDRLVRG